MEGNHILDLNEWVRLDDEAAQMEDREEGKARAKLLQNIMDASGAYDVHIREYAWKQTARKIMDRGVVIESVEREPVVQKWDEQFGSLVSDETKHKTIQYSDQFRWHLFSFELLSALREDRARAAFDSAEKSQLYLFFDYAPGAYLIQNAELLTAADIDAVRENSPLDYADMYFFDPQSRWIYMVTHEGCIGPYFFKAE